MSQVPTPSSITSAAANIGSLNAGIRTAQQSSLAAVGAPVVQAFGASGLTTDFQKGYELGLQTARVMITANPQVQLANIDPNQVL